MSPSPYERSNTAFIDFTLSGGKWLYTALNGAIYYQHINKDYDVTYS